MVWNNYILALDPGTAYTGYCLLSPELHPIRFGKESNEEVMRVSIDTLSSLTFKPCIVVIERVASYGMAVGSEVFTTCEWIGRFAQELERYAQVAYVYRKDEKLMICGSTHANDATIKRALADRFAYGQSNYGKGTKKEHGFFYGFKADIWSAFAVGVTYYDMQKEKNMERQVNERFKGVGY